MPLPLRRPANTPAEQETPASPAVEPKLADAPTAAPLGAEEAPIEAPRLAAEEEYVEDSPAFRVLPPRATLPAAPVLPVARPASPVEAATTPEPAPTPVAAPIVQPPAPEAAVAQPTPTAAVSAPTPVTPEVVRQPVTNALAPEETTTQQAIKSLSREVRESVKLLFDHITDEESSEVILNGPHSVGFKRGGQRFFDDRIDFVDAETYHFVINNFLLPLSSTSDRIGQSDHLIEGQLSIQDDENPGRPPLIARMHIMAPPAVETAKITIAKKARTRFTIDNFVQSGSMTPEMGEFVKALARGRATVLFSGVSGSGKSTFLEALSRDFDVNDRIVLIEDTPELKLPVSDVVELVSSQARPGEDPKDVVTLEWLVRQANRMRPDRIIVGEVRGAEMAEFLVAANSGADGSMTTLHAESPQKTIQKIVSLAMKAESSKSEMSIYRDIASSVQIIIQLALIDGKHVVSQIEEVSDTVLQNGNGIATNPLFSFDRSTGEFVVEGRVSDGFRMFLSQRGVTLPQPQRISSFNRGF